MEREWITQRSTKQWYTVTGLMLYGCACGHSGDQGHRPRSSAQNWSGPPTHPPTLTLASSEVSFKALALKLGVADEVVTKLGGKGIQCMAYFSYSIPHIPGQSDDSQFVECIVVPILGGERDKHEFQFRRLLSESYAVATEEFRSKRRRTSIDRGRIMSDRERGSRLENLRQRLPKIPAYDNLVTTTSRPML